LANSPQTRKRARENIVRNQRNRSYRSSVRTSIKALLNTIAAGDKEGAPIAYRNAVSIIDRSSSKGLMPRNTAARLKSRLNKRVKVLVV
jgi:small subunit ribosomal protein S20